MVGRSRWDAWLPCALEIMENPSPKQALKRWVIAVQGGIGLAGRFIHKMTLRPRMGRGTWVVVVTQGTRFLGRFSFHSEAQAGKFIESATRRGFRAEIVRESMPSATLPQHPAA